MPSVVPREVLLHLFAAYEEEKTAGECMPTEAHVWKRFNL